MKKSNSRFKILLAAMAAVLVILGSSVAVFAGTASIKVDSNVRTKASMSGNVIAVLPAGKKVTTEGKSGKWTFITYEAGDSYIEGYVYTGNLSSSASKGVKRKTATAIWLRKGPGKKYSKILAVPAGKTVTVLSENKSWYKVTYKGKTGYMKAGYFVDETNLRTTSTAIYLRKSPSKKSKALAVVPENAMVEVLKHTGRWYRIRYNGKTGYIHDGYFKTDNPANQTTRIVKTTIFIRSTMSVLRSRSNVIGWVPKGQEVTVLSKPNSRWYRISYRGKTGYIRSGYFV